MRLLVIEDNPELGKLLGKGLNARGFEVDILTTVDDAKAALKAARYAILILDLGLPDGDGLSLLRELRGRADPLPVLILTARSGVADRISGLRCGADDYLVKPFAFDELVARIEALLRRPGQFLGSSLSLANLVFDTDSRQAFVNDKAQPLSARETAVLELLMRHKRGVVSKKLIEDQIFGLSAEVGSNAAEVYVHRLRKQLSDGGAKVKINTIRGIGYIMSELE